MFSSSEARNNGINHSSYYLNDARCGCLFSLLFLIHSIRFFLVLRIILRKKRKLFVSLFLLCTLAACVLYVAGYISHDLIMKDPILGTRIMLSSSFMYYPGFGLLIYWINLSGPITVLLFRSPICDYCRLLD